MKLKNYKISYIIIFIILILTTFLLINSPTEKFQGSIADNSIYDIIIVAGQSNAIGRGKRNICDNRALQGCSTGVDLRKNSTLEGPITNISGYDSIDAAKIKMFTSETDPVGAKRNKIVGCKEPIQQFQYRGSDDNNQLSFTSSFVREYINRMSIGSRKVLIVGCSWGASAILNSDDAPKWSKSYGPDNPDPDSIYERTVERLRNVKNLLTPNNSSKVVALLWHQGESDMHYIFSNSATRDARKLQYKSALKETLTGMRRDIIKIFKDNNSGYTFPILLGGLSYDKQFNRITGVRNTREYRKEMSELISEVSTPTDKNFIPTSAFVSSDRLSIAGFNRRLEGNSVMDSRGRIVGDDDISHFSATDIREFGKRYFHYYNLIK